MNILILGATGFIGSWITTELINSGHKITCCVRNKKLAKQMFPQAKLIDCDFYNDRSKPLWESRLKEIEIIINCVGIFYHPNKKIVWLIHYDLPKIIYDAALSMNIKKIIHLSALNVDINDTEYAKSKRAIEIYLKSKCIPSIILRPSLVYGPTASGGMSLFRALAATPFLIPLVGNGNQQIQPIHVEDLTKSIHTLLDIEVTNNLVLDAVPHSIISLKTMLSTLRNWLGFPISGFIKIPIFIIKIINVIGNYFPYSIVNSTALNMLTKNNISNKEKSCEFENVIGFSPRDFFSGVYSSPSSNQDRWHARLVLIRPFLRISLAFIWLMSAITSAFLYSKTSIYSLLTQVGITVPHWQSLFLFGACAINFLIGFFLLISYKNKLNCILQIFIILLYTSIISWKLPHLWLEPFGSIVKNVPVVVAILVLYILEDNR